MTLLKCTFFLHTLTFVFLFYFMSRLQRKKIDEHQKTKDYIISALKAYKQQKYDDLNENLYQVRTNDLREILPELQPTHRYIKIVLSILKNEELTMCHKEALYNLAVFLGRKENVEPLVNEGALDIAFHFLDSEDEMIVHHAVWCLFGISASTPKTRQICLDREILPTALNLMLKYTDKIQDIAGQIVYGIFHMDPLPTEEEALPLFEKAKYILKINTETNKYVLWALHFAMQNNPKKVLEYDLLPVLVPHLHSQEQAILIPVLIVISNLFTSEHYQELVPYMNDIKLPLTHFDASVRIQDCRTIADFIRDVSTIDILIEDGILETITNISLQEEPRVREQAVYAVIRCFGIGTKMQRRKVSELGGTKSVVQFSVIAQYPFNCNLIECLFSLLENDFDFFGPVLKEMDAVSTLYSLLSYPEPVVSSKTANLIGFIGESYKQAKFK